MASMEITHDPERYQFSVDLGSYHAVLMYAKRGKVLDFYHIYVPDPFRNQGLAGKILIHAFEYAKMEGYQVVPTCPFIRDDFLKRFPQYREIAQSGEFLFFSQK